MGATLLRRRAAAIAITVGLALFSLPAPGLAGPDVGRNPTTSMGTLGDPSPNVIWLDHPGDQTATQDVPFDLQMSARSSEPGQTLTFSAFELPPGLSIVAATGLISGTPTTLGRYDVTVHATDTTGADGSIKFSITVLSPIRVANPRPQGGYVGQPVLLQVEASDAVPGRTLSYAAKGLPDGVSIDSSTGLISGLPIANGYFQAFVTVSDDAGRYRDESFIWYVAPAQTAGRPGSIMLAGTALCLGAQGGGTADGTPVVAGSCNQQASQVWTVQPNGTVQASGKCLTVPEGDGAEGVHLWSCHGRGTQQWRIASFGQLVSLATGSCLSNPGSPAPGGTPVEVQPCGAAGQRWVTPAGPIVSGVPGMCADSGAGTNEYLQVWYCADAAAQAWTVSTDGTVRVGNQCLTAASGATDGTTAALARCGGTGQQWDVQPGGLIVHRESGRCLTNPGDSLVSGTRLVVDSCRGAAGQLWHVE